MDDAVQTLRTFGIPVEIRVLSAHRTPDDTMAFARGAADAGIKVISYDRLIVGSPNVDYYATFDNFKLEVVRHLDKKGANPPRVRMKAD